MLCPSVFYRTSVCTKSVFSLNIFICIMYSKRIGNKLSNLQTPSPCNIYIKKMTCMDYYQLNMFSKIRRKRKM